MLSNNLNSDQSRDFDEERKLPIRKMNFFDSQPLSSRANNIGGKKLKGKSMLSNAIELSKNKDKAGGEISEI